MNSGAPSESPVPAKAIRTLALWAVLLLVSIALVYFASTRRGRDNPVISASYVWGPEVNTMKPCGSDSTFWVLASPELIARLRAAHETLRTKPYAPIFIRVHGQRSTKSTDGFAEQTNGYFEVTELLEARAMQQGECS